MGVRFPHRILAERIHTRLTSYFCSVPYSVAVLRQAGRAHLQSAQIGLLKGLKLLHGHHLPVRKPAGEGKEELDLPRPSWL